MVVIMALPKNRLIDTSGLPDFNQIHDRLLDMSYVPENPVDIGLPVKTHAPSPEWPLEAALCERFDVDSDPDGIPYITFPVGGVFSALERVYAKRYPSTQPPLIIARLSIKPHYIDSMYMMPVPIAGHTQNAAVAFSSYTPRTYTLGGHDTKKARQLTRQLVGSKTHMSQENPFAPKPKKLVGEIGKTDNGLSAAARSGQLGTR